MAAPPLELSPDGDGEVDEPETLGSLTLAETARLLGPNGVILADIITSEYVARGAGHRGEMWVNRPHFDQIAEAIGFRCHLLGRFSWGPFAQRHMLRLTRR